MGFEGQDFDDLEGVSPSFVEALYKQYRTNPSSVDPKWKDWFDGLEATAQGPSWAKAHWPLDERDDLTGALDPTQMEPAAKPSKAPKSAAPSTADIAVSCRRFYSRDDAGTYISSARAFGC